MKLGSDALGVDYSKRECYVIWSIFQQRGVNNKEWNGGYESQHSDSANEEGKSCTSESNILAEMPQPTRAAGDVNITHSHSIIN